MASMVLEPTRSKVDIAAMLVRSGNIAGARELLRKIVAQEPANERAWAWLAYVESGIEAKRAALYRAYRLNPSDTRLYDALLKLMSPPHSTRAAQNGVFISYVRADELFALDLRESLRAAGVKVWLDMTDVPEDMDWHTAVDQALDRCGLMLLLLSPTALKTGELRAERQQFLDAGKIVVPVLHNHCDLTALNLMHPPVDFRHGYALGLQQLVKILI
jgi:predicted transcriptional regulator with HTH domain